MTDFNNEPTDRRAYESMWTRQLAIQHLSPEDNETWKDYRAIARLYLAPGSKIVHWKLDNGKPTIQRSFYLIGMHADQACAEYVFSDGNDHEVLFTVSHIPKMLADTGVFVWIPHHMEMRHTPIVKNFGYVSLGLAIRQHHNPASHLYAGTSYVTTLKDFELNWQDKTIVRS